MEKTQETDEVREEVLEQLRKSLQPAPQFLQRLEEDPDELLWRAVTAFQGYPFKTATGLLFTYKIQTGRNGRLTRELLVDRCEKSKPLVWSSFRIAFHNSQGMDIVKRPKALGDIRGVSYIYPILWKFGLINVPENIAEKMG